jgi:DNA polymerase III subunit delta
MAAAMMRSFMPTERFIADVAGGKQQGVYVFLGDEAFFRDRCRHAILQHLVPEDLRELALYDLDLSDVSVQEVLDRAQTPSLMAPFQVFFVRGLKNLYGRGQKKEEFAAIERYAKDPNPNALVIFVADHIRIPADVRRMEMTDKDRYERIRETLGDFCTILEMARVDENEGMRWAIETAESSGVKLEPDAGRELVDALGSDMLSVANELEKLILYVGEKKRITLGDVETMVLSAKQRSLYELTDAISSKDTARALSVLESMLSSGDGDEAAIGHVYMLSRTFRQMLVILEKNVRDSRAIWQVLWQGFRLPPFAAEDVIKQARRFGSRRELTRAIRLVARADFALRSNPPSKRMVLEKLVLDLTAKPSVAAVIAQQELQLV